MASQKNNKQLREVKMSDIPLNHQFCWKIFIASKVKLMEEKYQYIILDFNLSKGKKRQEQHFASAIF